jgi:CRISPR-associated protein Cmr6
MANLSWLYYKGYHKGFNELWEKLDDPEPADKKEIEVFFTGKNKVFWNYTLPAEKNICGDVLFTTTYPGLLIGSGYTHEIGAIGESKIGFQLDHTTGLPIIPGSSVKGAIRAAFPQFEPDPKMPWLTDNTKKPTEISIEKAKYIARLLQWQLAPAELYKAIHQLEMHIFEGLDIEKSKEAGKAVYQSIYHRYIFYDALPKKGGKDDKLFGPDSITPHTAGPLKNPTPLLFLKVLPKVTYAFRFGTREMLFKSQFSEEMHENISLFIAILANFGLGAKTNIGYGQLDFDFACYGLKLCNDIEPAERIIIRGKYRNSTDNE